MLVVVVVFYLVELVVEVDEEVAVLAVELVTSGGISCGGSRCAASNWLSLPDAVSK